MTKINLQEKFSLFHDHWSPKVAAELNGQQVRLVKFQGDFVWHRHDAEDELFLVVKGRFEMQYRESSGGETSIWLEENEMIVVPRGVEHRPCAPEEVSVLLFEPASTVNTGGVEDARKRTTLSNI